MLTYGSELLKRTVTASFWQAVFGTPTPYDGLFWQRETDQETERYAYLGAPDMPSEWVGDRTFKALPEQGTSLKNTFWDSSIAVDKRHVEFEQLDSVASASRQLGAKAMAHRHKLLSTLAANGSTATTTVDRQAFFDTDHTDPGASYTTSQDNDLTAAAATNTQPTQLEAAAALRSCFDALLGYKDGAGDPLAVSLDPSNIVVVVPPVYFSVFNHVLTADSLTGPVGNDLQGRFTLRVDQFSSSAAAFHFYYTGSVHRAYILQVKSGIRLVDSIDPSSGNYLYSAFWVGQVGYGEWRTAILFTFT